VDWEYYTDGSGIYELNLISIDRLLEPWQLVNKYSLIEIYTCFILLYLNMTTKLN